MMDRYAEEARLKFENCMRYAKKGSQTELVSEERVNKFTFNCLTYFSISTHDKCIILGYVKWQGVAEK